MELTEVIDRDLCIYELFKNGQPITQIANDFNVSISLVYQVCEKLAVANNEKTPSQRYREDQKQMLDHRTQKIINLYIESGFKRTHQSIADELKITRSLVSMALNEAGYTKKTQYDQNLVDRIKELRLVDRLSVNAISSCLDVNKSFVSKVLRASKVSRVPCKRKKFTLPHVRKTTRDKTVYSLRKQGLSAQAIANQFKITVGRVYQICQAVKKDNGDI